MCYLLLYCLFAEFLFSKFINNWRLYRYINKITTSGIIGYVSDDKPFAVTT